MGTEKESFIELTERIGRKTGGLSVSPFVSDKRGTDEPVAMVMISGKAMGDKAGDLLDLFSDVLLTARLDDRDRFKQVRLHAPVSTSRCFQDHLRHTLHTVVLCNMASDKMCSQDHSITFALPCTLVNVPWC